MIPAATVTIIRAGPRLASGTPPLVNDASVPLSRASAGPVGELISPTVPPNIPETSDKHAAPSRPASAPPAVPNPCDASSATPKAMACGTTTATAAKPAQTSVSRRSAVVLRELSATVLTLIIAGYVGSGFGGAFVRGPAINRLRSRPQVTPRPRSVMISFHFAKFKHRNPSGQDPSSRHDSTICNASMLGSEPPFSRPRVLLVPAYVTPFACKDPRHRASQLRAAPCP